MCLSENNKIISGAAIKFTDKDVEMGMVLAANIGNDVAVSFDASYNIDSVSVITDEYWNGFKK